EALQQKHAFHIANLDAALTIIAKVGILYRRLERDDQKDLLRQMIERVVVNPEGIIIRLELLAPFSYLRHVSKRIEQDRGEAAVVEGKTKTSPQAGPCSDYVQSGESDVAPSAGWQG
ncbi:MAG: hypothetical protein AAF125_26800, partial [Chloroflexota bacterium]